MAEDAALLAWEEVQEWLVTMVHRLEATSFASGPHGGTTVDRLIAWVGHGADSFG
jgi:hypothetical protein